MKKEWKREGPGIKIPRKEKTGVTMKGIHSSELWGKFLQKATEEYTVLKKKVKGEGGDTERWEKGTRKPPI